MNSKNVEDCRPKKEDYGLMTLVIIRLGNRDYHSEEKSILDFLTVIFQPHQKGFRKKLFRYISFEKELGVREEKHMIGLGLSIYEEGIEKGIEKGIKKGIGQGREEGILGMISALRNLHIEEDTILQQMQEQFRMTKAEAQEYLSR